MGEMTCHVSERPRKRHPCRAPTTISSGTPSLALRLRALSSSDYRVDGPATELWRRAAMRVCVLLSQAETVVSGSRRLSPEAAEGRNVSDPLGHDVKGKAKRRLRRSL